MNQHCVAATSAAQEPFNFFKVTINWCEVCQSQLATTRWPLTRARGALSESRRVSPAGLSAPNSPAVAPLRRQTAALPSFAQEAPSLAGVDLAELARGRMMILVPVITDLSKELHFSSK